MRVIIIAVLLFICFAVSAQNTVTKTDTPKVQIKSIPWFDRDGIIGISNYVKKNLKYPEAARKCGVSGKFIVRFTVDEEGTVSKAQIEKIPECDSEYVDWYLSPKNKLVTENKEGCIPCCKTMELLRDEALRIVIDMPKFEFPAYDVNGEPVKFEYNLPVNYTLR